MTWILPILSCVLAFGAERRPLLVLVESDPWLMVVGSDSPSFALYDDGLVIFHRIVEGAEPTLVSATLDAEARLTLVVSVVGGDRAAFDALAPKYECSDASDQPTCTIHSWVGEKRKSVSVYGDLRRDADAREKAPLAFRHALDAMHAYANAGAKPWLPEKIEVLAWPYEYSPETPLLWPKDWPGVDDASTRHRGEDLSLYLDSKELRRLRDLLRSRGEKQAIEIGGKKWAVSYRIPFPREDVWMR
ncbi:MAG: hypothetical protein HYR85_20500 [Planctomycetes bacterium]|nr:hypothetical protein [Planctomycetota bacterium]MBI3845676.1 hypothetical protein [Planctomycetota bacterium]